MSLFQAWFMRIYQHICIEEGLKILLLIENCSENGKKETITPSRNVRVELLPP